MCLKIFSLISLIVFSASQICNAQAYQSKSNSTNMHAHSTWNELTQKHVSARGFVNYKGFIQDSVKLNQYLASIAEHPPTSSWTSNQRKAFWINAYNAFTIDLVIKHYPIASIKDIAGSIYKVNTPWDIKFIHIGDQTYDLNNIEHSILRKAWNDPRIHAAINCASVSCPALLNEAFIPRKLEQQLDAQMKRFINDESKNTIGKTQLELSKLFRWFAGDFKTEAMDLIDYINQYTHVKVDKKAHVSYKTYNWNLNDSK